MKLELNTSIEINATPKQVWKTFSEFDQYKERGFFVSKVEGKMEEGQVISITAGGTSFKPALISYKPEKEMVWIGRLWIKGLFDGKHQFYLVANGDGTTTFQHKEDFSGLLVPLFKKQLLEKIKQGFIDMNHKLKALVENSIHTDSI